MFCPACEAEFVEGITRCPDDLVDLVDELPPKEPHRPRLPLPPKEPPRHRRPLPAEAVIAYELRAEPELGEPRAEFIRIALEENRIPVWIEGEFPLQGAYGRLLAPNLVRIFVRPEDLEAAREVIGEVEGSRPALDALDDGDDDEDLDG